MEVVLDPISAGGGPDRKTLCYLLRVFGKSTKFTRGREWRSNSGETYYVESRSSRCLPDHPASEAHRASHTMHPPKPTSRRPSPLLPERETSETDPTSWVVLWGRGACSRGDDATAATADAAVRSPGPTRPLSSLAPCGHLWHDVPPRCAGWQLRWRRVPR